MQRRIWLGISGGSLALLLCAVLLSGAVFAQEDGESPATRGQAFIERLAGKLGITTEELEAAVQETQTDMIDDDVARGRLSEEQAAAMKERIEAGAGGFAFGRHHANGPTGGRFMQGPGLMSFGSIAGELGMTQAELRQQLAEGATLLEIIESSGTTVDEVVAALVQETTVRLDEAVASGRLTQEQADAMLTGLSERLTEQIESGVFCPVPSLRDTEAEPTTSTTSI